MDRNSQTSIIAMAPNEWEGPWMNRQQLLSRLAKRGWPIVYSSGRISWWERGSERWKKTRWFDGYRHLDNVLVDKPGRSVLRWPKVKSYDKWVLRKHAIRLRVKSGWDKKNVIKIAFLFHPTFFPYLEFLNPDYVIYHVYDFHTGMPGSDPQTAIWEKKLIERCDILTVISNAIADNLDAPGPNKAKILGNGVDTGLFMPSELNEPEDLKMIPKPRIGYTGNINFKLDWETIDYIAKTRPDWQWVFVGSLLNENPSDVKVTEAWQRCQKYKNVHFLGRKIREDMPNYVNHMNVGAICYRIREKDWSFFGYPLKLHEYLACGKPVACSALPAVMPFSDVVEIPASPEEWIQSIQRCIDSDARKKDAALRVNVARENNWDKRVDELEKYMESVIFQGKAKPSAQ